MPCKRGSVCLQRLKSHGRRDRSLHHFVSPGGGASREKSKMAEPVGKPGLMAEPSGATPPPVGSYIRVYHPSAYQHRRACAYTRAYQLSFSAAAQRRAPAARRHWTSMPGASSWLAALSFLVSRAACVPTCPVALPFDWVRPAYAFPWRGSDAVWSFTRVFPERKLVLCTVPGAGSTPTRNFVNALASVLSG